MATATVERVWLGYEQRWYSGPSRLWYLEWYETRSGVDPDSDDFDPIDDTDCHERRFPSRALAIAHARTIFETKDLPWDCATVGETQLKHVCTGLWAFERIGDGEVVEPDTIAHPKEE